MSMAPFLYFGNNLLSPKHQSLSHFVVLAPHFVASGEMGAIKGLSDSREQRRASCTEMVKGNEVKGAAVRCTPLGACIAITCSTIETRTRTYGPHVSRDKREQQVVLFILF